jgi:hypothetical protein
MTVGERVSDAMVYLNSCIIQHEEESNDPPEYTEEGFAAITNIFLSVVTDRMWSLQEKENMPYSDRAAMVKSLGKQLTQIMKTFTDVNLKC